MDKANLCFLPGPRFVLNLIRIFEGSFGGPCLYENPHYSSPNEVSHGMSSVWTTTLSFVVFDQHRRLLKQQAGMKYRNRVDARTFLTVRKGDMELPEDEVEQVFQQQT